MTLIRDRVTGEAFDLGVKKLLKDGIDSFGEPVKASKWRNFYYTKDGRRIIGDELHASVEAAQAAFNYGNDWKREAKLFPKIFIVKNALGEISFYSHEYAFAIQLPVRS